MYQYQATVERVVDGDTIYVTGVNTPEIRGAERPESLKVKALCKKSCP